MSLAFPPELYLLLVMAVPAVVGGWLAWGRGRNPLLWGLLCAVFPVFILVVWVKKPCREVKGFFRRCRVCGEWIRWREEPCRYCAWRENVKNNGGDTDDGEGRASSARGSEERG